MCFPEHSHAFRHTHDVSGPPETANCAAFPVRTQPKLGIREPTHVASSKEPSVYKYSHVGTAYFTRKFSCDPLHTIVSAQHQAHVDLTAPMSTTVSLLSPMRFASCASTPRTQVRRSAPPNTACWSSARPRRSWETLPPISTLLSRDGKSGAWGTGCGTITRASMSSASGC